MERLYYELLQHTAQVLERENGMIPLCESMAMSFVKVIYEFVCDHTQHWDWTSKSRDHVTVTAWICHSL
jgi:hypothetical protein